MTPRRFALVCVSGTVLQAGFVEAIAMVDPHPDLRQTLVPRLGDTHFDVVGMRCDEIAILGVRGTSTFFKIVVASRERCVLILLSHETHVGVAELADALA